MNYYKVYAINKYFDVGLRKFKRACEKAAIVPEIRAREFYEKPTAVRKRKMAAAIKRAHKTNRKFRDIGAWYHFMIVVDTAHGHSKTRGCKISHEKS